jgi:hypothetical protein
MKKVTFWLLAAAFAFCGVATAADHLDSPSATADTAADISDVFAWTSADGSKVNLILNVSPAAAADASFSDAVQYVFHLNRTDAFGVAGTSSAVMCTFDAAGAVSCWAGDEYVSGDASAAAGLANESGSMKVFAGPRNDPFFFPFAGFLAVVDTVKAVASSLVFDAHGCPTLDEDSALALLGILHSNSGFMPLDFFAAHNVLSLVVEVDAAAIAGEGNMLSVWASTRRSY